MFTFVQLFSLLFSDFENLIPSSFHEQGIHTLQNNRRYHHHHHHRHRLCRCRCPVHAGSSSRDGEVTVYALDINQVSLPTPFYCVLISVSVFIALSTAFHSINSPDNSPLSQSVLPVLILSYWSFQIYIYISIYFQVSFSPKELFQREIFACNSGNIFCFPERLLVS